MVGGFLISLPPTWVFANRRHVYGELLDESLAAPTAFLLPLFNRRHVYGELLEKEIINDVRVLIFICKSAVSHTQL